MCAHPEDLLDHLPEKADCRKTWEWRRNWAVHKINCEHKDENGKSRNSEENIVSRRKCHYAGEDLA